MINFFLNIILLLGISGFTIQAQIPKEGTRGRGRPESIKGQI